MPSSEKPVPKDPLAREASEIRIQIRPPTPQKKDGSYIPVPAKRGRSNSMSAMDDMEEDPFEDSEEAEEEEAEEEPEEEEQEYPSSDSEVRTAKEMQHGRRLPQLPKKNYRPPPVPAANNKSNRPTFGRGPPPPTTERNTPGKPIRNAYQAKPQRNDKPGRQQAPMKPFYDPDGPKLPSLYRQRITRY